MRLAPLAVALLFGCNFDPESLGTSGPGLGGSSSSGGSSPTSTGPLPGDTTSDPSSTTSGELADSTSTGSESGSGSSSTGDGTTGDGMVDHGLLARWWIDEASSGQAPILLADSTASPMDLPLTYADDMPVFVSTNGNIGLYWDSRGLDGRAMAMITGSKIHTELGASRQATFELVAAVNDSVSQTSRLLHIGTAGSDDFVIGANDSSTLQVRWRNGPTMDFETTWDGTRQVVHVVVDSDQANVVDRVRAYVGGVELLPASVAGPEQGLTLPLDSRSSLVIGNRSDGQRSIEGAIHYAAIYLEPLDPAEIVLNVTTLKGDDDGP